MRDDATKNQAPIGYLPNQKADVGLIVYSVDSNVQTPTRI
jgi:hypothetical protein